MSIVAWMITGLIIGCFTIIIVYEKARDIILDYLLLGMLGAIAGGIFFEKLTRSNGMGFDIWSLTFAVVGAVLLLLTFTLFRKFFERFTKTH